MRISTLLLPPFPFPPALPRPRHPQISCGGRSSRREVRQEGLGCRGSGCWQGGAGCGSQGSRAVQGGSAGGEGTEPPSVSCQLSGFSGTSGVAPAGCHVDPAGEGLGEQTREQPGTRGLPRSGRASPHSCSHLLVLPLYLASRL